MDWAQIPADVVDWFRDIFAEANRQVSETLMNVPNIREPSLDDAFIQALVPRSAPTLLPSGALVRMDVHNIGGLRRLSRWEVADIGVVVFIIRGGKVVARKLGLLQAKRLYPLNNVVQDDDPVGFQYGFNALLTPNPSPTSMALCTRYDFTDACLYGAVRAKSPQVQFMEKWTKTSGFSVAYLLYNPPSVPVTISYPLVARHVLPTPPVLGCRVLTMQQMHGALAVLAEGQSPSLNHVASHVMGYGWRIEHWAADLLLRCKVGEEYGAEDEEALLPIIERRSGPIGAALAIHIELPAD
jgi:hypothetical protein